MKNHTEIFLLGTFNIKLMYHTCFFLTIAQKSKSILMILYL